MRTQTKIIQEQGSSAVLRPPYGTGCQTLHNTENVAFSAAAEILFVFDSFATYQPPDPPHRISFPTVPTASLSLQLPPFIAHPPSHSLYPPHPIPPPPTPTPAPLHNYICVCARASPCLFVVVLRARHDHSKIVPCGMIFFFLN